LRSSEQGTFIFLKFLNVSVISFYANSVYFILHSTFLRSQPVLFKIIRSIPRLVRR
jgi:hypothetical protein